MRNYFHCNLGHCPHRYTQSQSPASPNPLNFKLSPFSFHKSATICPPNSFLHPKVPGLSNCPDDFLTQPCTLNQCKRTIFPIKELLWENWERGQKNGRNGTCMREQRLEGICGASEDTCASLRNLCNTLEMPQTWPPKRKWPLEQATEAAEAGLCMRKAFIFIFLLWALLAGDMLSTVLILKWQMCLYKTKLWPVQSFLSAWFTSHHHLSLCETGTNKQENKKPKCLKRHLLQQKGT